MCDNHVIQTLADRLWYEYSFNKRKSACNPYRGLVYVVQQLGPGALHDLEHEEGTEVVHHVHHAATTQRAAMEHIPVLHGNI